MSCYLLGDKIIPLGGNAPDLVLPVDELRPKLSNWLHDQVVNVQLPPEGGFSGDTSGGYIWLFPFSWTLANSSRITSHFQQGKQGGLWN